MDDISRSVAKNVKSGQYFEDARQWYTYKYVGPVTERSTLLVMLVVMGLALCVVSYTFYALYPIKEKIPLIIKSHDAISSDPFIRPLGEDLMYPQKSLAEYLIRDYIENRESYNFEKREKYLLRIKNASSKQVFKQYTTEISITNPQSPVLVYQNGLRRYVEIVSIHFPGGYDMIDRAVVKFKATVEDKKTKQKTTTLYKATMRFSLSDLVYVSKTKSPFEFIVTNYSVQQN